MIGRKNTKPESTPLPPTTIIATAGIAIVLFVGMIWLAVVAPKGVPGRGYTYVDAEFREAANVPTSTEVRIAGKSAGQVVDARLENGIAKLRLQLRPGNVALHEDATARIGLKGLLGGKYVGIDPGGRGAELEDGATLPASRTSTAVDLVDIVQTFDESSRKALQHTLRGLGQGIAGRGEDVNDLLRTATPMARDLRRVSEAVLARDGAAARLLPALESTAAAFDPVRAQLAAGFRPGAAVFEVFAGRRANVQDTLEIAPSTLVGLRGGVDAATPLLNEVAGLARVATRFSRPAPVALRQTAKLLEEARPALRETSPLLRRLERAVPPTLLLLRRVDPVARPVTRALTTSLPPLVELGRRPCDLQSFAKNWRSMMGFGVAPGSGDPNGGLDDDAGLGSVNSVRLILSAHPTPDTLSLDTTTIKPVGNAYPGPCEAEKERRP